MSCRSKGDNSAFLMSFSLTYFFSHLSYFLDVQLYPQLPYLLPLMFNILKQIGSDTLPVEPHNSLHCPVGVLQVPLKQYDCKSNKKLLVYVKINVRNIYIMYFSEEISIRQVYCFILCPSTLDFSQTILTNHIHGSIINNFWICPSQ